MARPIPAGGAAVLDCRGFSGAAECLDGGPRPLGRRGPWRALRPTREAAARPTPLQRFEEGTRARAERLRRSPSAAWRAAEMAHLEDGRITVPRRRSPRRRMGQGHGAWRQTDWRTLLRVLRLEARRRSGTPACGSVGLTRRREGGWITLAEVSGVHQFARCARARRATRRERRAADRTPSRRRSRRPRACRRNAGCETRATTSEASPAIRESDDFEIEPTDRRRGSLGATRPYARRRTDIRRGRDRSRRCPEPGPPPLVHRVVASTSRSGGRSAGVHLRRLRRRSAERLLAFVRRARSPTSASAGRRPSPSEPIADVVVWWAPCRPRALLRPPQRRRSFLAVGGDRRRPPLVGGGGAAEERVIQSSAGWRRSRDGAQQHAVGCPCRALRLRRRRVRIGRRGGGGSAGWGRGGGTGPGAGEPRSLRRGEGGERSGGRPCRRS